MKKVLIIWALPQNDLEKALYETITEDIQNWYSVIGTPTDTKEATFKDDRERFDRALELVKECDIIIAECSNISTGQWIEIWIAHSIWKEIHVIAKEWSKISWLIKWCYSVKKVIFYKDGQDINLNLR